MRRYGLKWFGEADYTHAVYSLQNEVECLFRFLGKTQGMDKTELYEVIITKVIKYTRERINSFEVECL